VAKDVWFAALRQIATHPTFQVSGLSVSGVAHPLRRNDRYVLFETKESIPKGGIIGEGVFGA